MLGVCLIFCLKVYVRVCQKIKAWCVRCLWMPQNSPECARMFEHKNSIISRQEFAQCYSKQNWLWIESFLQRFYSKFHRKCKPNNPKILESFTKTDMKGVHCSLCYTDVLIYDILAIVLKVLLMQMQLHIESQYCLNIQNNPHKYTHTGI